MILLFFFVVLLYQLMISCYYIVRVAFIESLHLSILASIFDQEKLDLAQDSLFFPRFP